MEIVYFFTQLLNYYNHFADLVNFQIQVSFLPHTENLVSVLKRIRSDCGTHIADEYESHYYSYYESFLENREAPQQVQEGHERVEKRDWLGVFVQGGAEVKFPTFGLTIHQ